MILQTSATTTTSYRLAGWAAIASGIIGILAYGFLITAVITRTTMVLSRSVYLLFRAHDVSIILQFLLMIPAVLALYQFSQQWPPAMSRAMLNVGIGALLFTVFILLLVFPKVLNDDYYPIPVGVFGVWLMSACWRMKGIFSGWLRWFGLVVGLGLALFGSFPLGYAIFVDPVILHIPAIAPTTYPNTLANAILHQIIWIGSIMGVATLPVWTILLGRRLLR